MSSSVYAGPQGIQGTLGLTGKSNVLCKVCRKLYSKNVPACEKPYFHAENPICSHAKGYDRALHGAQGPQGPYYRREGFLFKDYKCPCMKDMTREELLAHVLSAGSLGE